MKCHAILQELYHLVLRITWQVAASFRFESSLHHTQSFMVNGHTVNTTNGALELHGFCENLQISVACVVGGCRHATSDKQASIHMHLSH